MKGTKIKKEKEKCPECGGKLVPEEDRFVCSICGHPVFSKALRHKYLERNKNPIVKDLDTLPRATVLKKWGILPGTLSQCLKRWKYKPGKTSTPPNSNPTCLGAMGSCQRFLNFLMSGRRRYSWSGLLSTRS